MCLVAGLHPDPHGSSQRSPDPLANFDRWVLGEKDQRVEGLVREEGREGGGDMVYVRHCVCTI